MLNELQTPEEQEFIRNWIAEHEHGPLQAHPRKLRGNQGYLTKMPIAFVERWRKLSTLADGLGPVQDDLSSLEPIFPPTKHGASLGAGEFHPKDDREYEAFVRGGTQYRSRNHEKLVRATGEWLADHGSKIANPHPIDLLMIEPTRIIFEAKTVGSRDPIFAIREAVGQLHEYRYFLELHDRQLCILLDKAPTTALVHYAEQELGLLIAWLEEPRLFGGPETATLLSVCGVTEPSVVSSD